MKAKTIIANPPFSISWDADNSLLEDERFKEYGKLAPKSKADFAFIQDMIYNLDDDGIMTVVLPHGVLFRGAAEQHIRRYLIEKMNYLDAVIGLPANIFFGTTIPTCILVFKKCRSRTDDVLFIDASQEFEKVKNQNVLRDSHIEKIVQTYQSRSVIDRFSHRATLKEIADNDYNLNIPRYVDTFEEEESIDIKVVLDNLKALEDKKAGLDQQINVYLKELGIL